MSSTKGLGAKIGVDGEAEYRKAMQNVIQQAKTLDSEMKLVASSFTAETTAQEKAAATSENLSKKIEVQQEKCRLLAEMVQKSAGATGEASTETLEYQELLNKAEAELNDMTTAQEEANKSTSAFGEGLKKLAGKAVVAGLEAAAAGVKAIGEAAKMLASELKNVAEESAAFADEILTLSTNTGLSTDTLQEYQYMAELTDTSLDTITGSLAKLTKNMSSAQSGTGSAADAFNKLGIAVTDESGALRSNQEVFDEVIAALGAMENPTERDAAAMAIFGKSAQDLNSLIAQGADGIAAFRQEAHDMGYVLDEDALGSLGAMDDAFQRLGLFATSLKNQIGLALAPALLAAGDNFMSFAQSVVSSVSEVSNAFSEGGLSAGMSALGSMLTGWLESLVGFAPQLLEAGMTMGMELVQGISDAIPSLSASALSLVETAVNTILENLPQVLETGMTLLLELVNGISEALPELIPKAVEAVLTIVDTLTRPDMLSQLIDAALTLILSLAEGLIAALPELIAKAPEIVANLVTAIVDNAPKLLTSALELVVTLANGIIDNLGEIAKSAGKIVITIVDGITSLISSFWTVGSDIVKGLWKGISDAYTWITGKIRGWVGDVISFFKKLLDIKSPSKVFAEIGGFVSKGFGVGILDNIGEVTGSLKTVAESGIDAFTNGLKSKQADIENALTSIADAVKDIFGEIKSSMDLKGDIAGLEFDVWERQYDAQNAELRDAYKRQEAAQKWLDQAKKAYEINDTETNRMLADAAQLTLDKINEQIEALEDEAAWDKYKKQQEMLSAQFETQTSVVSAAEAAYQEIVKQYGEGSAESLSYQKTLLQEKLSWEKLCDEIYNVVTAMEKLDSVYKFPGDAWDFVSDPAAEAIRSYIGAGPQESSTVSKSYGDLTFNISGSNLSVMDVARKVSSLFAAAWGRKKEVFA